MPSLPDAPPAPNQDPPRAPRPGWKLAGWQGLTLWTPPAWNLAAYSGDKRTGSLRMDNGEPASSAAVGVEARWSQAAGRLTQAELEKRLERYFASIAKQARRKKIAVASHSKPLPDAHRPERGAQRAFSWSADRKGTGRIWHCGECGRLVIAQVTGAAGGASSVASDILASLECHPPDPQWHLWSLYDLLTQVPTDFALQGKPQLMNIYVQLLFGRGQTLDRVSVEQWGVANVQLRGAYLNEWFRRKNAAQEATLRYDEQESEAHGHPALLLTGRRAGLVYWAGQAVPQLAKLQRPAVHFAACVWECPDSNKIHLVQSFTRRPEPELVAEIVARTPCH